MNPVRSALYAGFLYTLPLLVWLLSGLYGLDAAPPVSVLLAEGFSLLVVIQALAAALFVPRLAVRARFLDALTATLLLLAIPWPLLVLFRLASDIGLAIIIASQAVLFLWALLLLAAARTPVRRMENMVVTLIQIAGLTLALGASSPWLAWNLTP